jgi:tRNA-modifying protein YgfZ
MNESDRTELLMSGSTIGLLDHLGPERLRVAGSDALDLLHRLSASDLTGLKQGDVSDMLLLNEKGRVIDYAALLVVGQNDLHLVSETIPSKLAEWIAKYTIMEDVTTETVSSDVTILSLIGEKVVSFASSYFGAGISSNLLHIFSTPETPVHVFVDPRFASRIIHILIPIQYAGSLSDDLLRTEEILRIEGSTFENFRIEHGFPRGGKEITEMVNPLEIGLRPAISFTKGCYIGQEVIARLDTYQKVQRVMVGISFQHGFPLKDGKLITTSTGEEIGILTSVSPLQRKGYYRAIGIIRRELCEIGGKVTFRSTRGDYEGEMLVVY